LLIGAIIVFLVAHVVARPDLFPLSTYPMFSDNTTSISWLTIEGPDGLLLAGVLCFVLGIILWVGTEQRIVGAILTVASLILIGSFRVEAELSTLHQLFQPVAVLLILAGGTALRKGKLDMPTWLWTAIAVVGC